MKLNIQAEIGTDCIGDSKALMVYFRGLKIN